MGPARVVTHCARQASKVSARRLLGSPVHTFLPTPLLLLQHSISFLKYFAVFPDCSPIGTKLNIAS